MECLTTLKHPNIVELLDVLQFQGKAAMVLENGGADLGKLIHQHQGVSPYPAIEPLVDQLLAAVGHVHSHRIVHADLMPCNIVVDEGVLRLIGFGIAFAYVPGGRRGPCCFEDLVRGGFHRSALPYKAIELLLGDTYSGQPIDIWSIGCIVFELILCAPLFRSPCSPKDMVQECCLLIAG